MSDATNDPRHAHREEGFPQQHQDQPGHTEETTPKPDHGEESYVGLGRLVGSCDVISVG